MQHETLKYSLGDDRGNAIDTRMMCEIEAYNRTVVTEDRQEGINAAVVPAAIPARAET